jgi:hypothetical protein
MSKSKLQDLKRVRQDKPYFARDGGGLKGKVVLPGKSSRLGEDPSTRPWRVQLMVQPSEIITAYIPVIYYVRGRNPHVACTMAHQLWHKWEKHEQGITTEYPDVVEMGYAECVDENDFASAWQEIKKYELKSRCAGSPEDPMAFTCIGRTEL